MAMTVETRTEGEGGDGVLVVELIGPADLAGAEMLQRQMTLLSARRPGRVVFDLSQMTFIASMCMGTLVAFRRGCDKWNGTMVLAGVTEPVATALKRARLDQVFTMLPSLEAALAQFASTRASAD
jgi:anti-anti-sigma factor